MTKATATYNINIDLIQKITHRARQTGKSRSVIVDKALAKGLGMTEDDEDKILQIEKEILELKEIVMKVFNIPDIQD